jgi:ring-1,2-phenylacetyl-CoA epoxidase subunit PaaC
MQRSLDFLWPFTGEPFQPTAYEQYCTGKGLAPDVAMLKPKWDRKIEAVFGEATLAVPKNVWMQSGGKQGRHTEHLGYLLTEMQTLQRAYPGNEW